METIETVESAYSRGKTKFEQWEAQFEESWNRPVIAGQIGTLLASIPLEVRARLPQRALKALEDKILGGNYATQIPQELSGEPLRPGAQTRYGQVPGELPINE